MDLPISPQIRVLSHMKTLLDVYIKGGTRQDTVKRHLEKQTLQLRADWGVLGYWVVDRPLKRLAPSLRVWMAAPDKRTWNTWSLCDRLEITER